jgi:hypothetical protein
MIKQFNKHAAQIRPLLQKALTSAAGVGEALTPQYLEQVITNTVIRILPEFALLETQNDPHKKHEFNRVTSLGSAGGAMGENAITPTRNSTYVRDDVTLKVVRRKGAVTNFLQDSSEAYTDATGVEMENVLRSHVFDLNFYNLYGNADSNPYEYSGVDRFVTSNRFQNGFSSGAPTVPTDLTFLDNMIDKNSRGGGDRHRKAFYMSPEMLSRVSQLITNVRVNNGIDNRGLTQIEINGGWRLNAYRDIPIVTSTFLGGYGVGTMGAIVPVGSDPGTGGFSDGTYYIRVSKMTLDGESMASAEANVTLSGGTATQIITISFTDDPDALNYKVYFSTSAGLTNMTLVKMATANVYDSEGTITGRTTSIVLSSPVADANVSGMTADHPLTAVGGVNGEIIILHDLDKYQGLGKYAYTNRGGNRVDGVVSMKPLAETDDNLPFLCKTYGALVPSFERTSVISRGWRVV